MYVAGLALSIGMLTNHYRQPALRANIVTSAGVTGSENPGPVSLGSFGIPLRGGCLDRDWLCISVTVSAKRYGCGQPAKTRKEGWMI